MADGSLPVQGVDYTGGANIAALVSAGKKFACRYGGPGGDWKHITPAEAQALSAAGVAVVANAEKDAGGLVRGWAEGYEWASLAEAHFARCGMPAGRPIYFSVDFDVTSTQWAAVAAALRGAAEKLGGVHRVGVYGGRRAMAWARRDGVAQWFWQTLAWSGGLWEPGNHIEQYHNDVALAGIRLDLDRALVTDFGQWTTGVDMTPDQDAKLNALYQALIPDPPVRVQGAWTHTRPDGRSVPINPLYNAIDHVVELLEKVAKQTGVDPAELEALKAAARAGAEAGVAAAADELAAAVAHELAGELGLTAEQVQAASERAVRKVLGAVDGATPGS